jgi:eukaryotic-like serine/threonine-protein kinase
VTTQQLTSDSRKQLEDVVARFEAAWQRGERPALEAYLPAEEALRLAVLQELVHTDLEYAWKAGLGTRVESYLERFPELCSHDQFVLELIAAEWQHRVRLQEPVSRLEYERRFPRQVARLTEILEDVLPPSLEGRVDQICDRFEAAWKAGQRPVIQDYLADVADEDRSVVLAELMALDLACRQRESATGEEPQGRLGLSSHTKPPTLADRAVPGPPGKRSVTDPSNGVPATTEQSPVEMPVISDDAALPPTADQPSDQPRIISSEGTDQRSDSAERTREHSATDTLRLKALSAADCPEIPGYHILGELGRGGMGVVYKAEQLALKRVVALKIVLASTLARPKRLIRFRMEAEAVARLQHPNIVQIYEVGEHDGVPFFTLEYVAGGSLASKRGQPGPVIAGIMRALAQAIHAAHQRGILHRDLKPANVLLTADGAPKVTDFGLAKQLDQDSGHTQAGDVMGTPSYMAPEQAAGKIKELGVWTDVYSLGAILYELLTGRPPFKGKTMLDTLELVRSQEPVPPRHFQPKTPRDLEIICLKCLEKEPGKRYASADALAEDLRRFLAHEPILARATTAWEQAVKWGRRRPALVGLIGLGTFTVVSLFAGALVFARQEYNRAEKETALHAAAELERSHAEENFAHARAAVDQMLTGVSRDRLAFEPRMEQVRRELLHKALRFYERFLDVKGDSPQVRWEAGQAYNRVGDIQDLLGQHAEAEKAYRSAVAVFGDLAAHFPDNAEYRHDLAAAHSNLGSLLKTVGRPSEAEHAYQQAMDILGPLARDYPQKPDYRRALGAIYRSRGTLRQEQKRPSEADQDFRSALAVFESLVAGHRQVPDYRAELARCLNNHGIQQQADSQNRVAEEQYVRALGLFHELASQYPAVPDYRQQEAITLSQLAHLKRDTSLLEAEAAFRQALRLRQALVLDFPSVPAYRQELADTTMHLALLKGAGRNAEADQTYLDSLKIKAQLVVDFAKVPGFRRDLATSYASWAILLQTNGRLAEGAKAYQQALDLLGKLVADFPAEADYKQEEASALVNLGTLQQLLNQPAEAEKSYRRALVRRQQLARQFEQLPDYQQELARAHLNLGTLLQLNGQFSRAETAYRDAVAILEKLVAIYPTVPDHRHELAVSYNNLGNLLQATQRFKDAEEVWRQAVAILAQMTKEMPRVPSYRQELARTLNQLAILLASTVRLPDAEKAWNQAVELQVALIKEFPDKADYRLELARSHGNLGVAQLHGKPPERALVNLDRAIELMEELAKDPATAAQYWEELRIHHFNRASLLTQLGQPREAEQSWKRTETLQRQLVKVYPNAVDYQANLAQTLTIRARLWLKEGKHDEARKGFQDALVLYQAAQAASPEQPRYRQGVLESGLGLVEFHLELENHAAAAQAVEELTKNVPPKGNEPPRSAELLVRGMLLARNDAKLTDAQKKELAGKYADRAVALIRQAIAGGFQDIGYLKKAPGLAPLRARDDFQKLVEDLERKKP